MKICVLKIFDIKNKMVDRDIDVIEFRNYLR